MTGHETQWQRDQSDAAFREAHQILTVQHALSRVAPTDAIHAYDPGTAGEWIDGLADRFMGLMEQPGLKVCPHLGGTKPVWPQPVYFRTWKHSLRCMRHCQPLLGFHAPAGDPCFRCDNVPGDPLYIQIHQIGCVAFYFGLCQSCLSRTQAELVRAERSSA